MITFDKQLFLLFCPRKYHFLPPILWHTYQCICFIFDIFNFY